MANEVEHILTFAGSTVGYRLHGLGQPQITLVTEPKVIQPFWWKTAIIDGRYPSYKYDWSFSVIMDSDDPWDYERDFHSLYWMSQTSTIGPTVAKTVNIYSISANSFGTPTPSTNPIMTFGPCFFTGAQHTEPGDVMVTNFGIVEVKFMGSRAPSVI